MRRVPRSWLSKKPLIKELTRKRKSQFGRSRGKIVVGYKARGLNSCIRYIDTCRLIWNLPGMIIGFERNRGASCYLALIAYPVGIFSYVRACAGLAVGDTIIAGWNVPARLGNALPLRNIPLNIRISSIETRPGSGASLALAPGAWAKISSKSESYANLVFASGRVKKVDLNCLAVVGRVSNTRWHLFRLTKAGQQRLHGVRPRVRGVAKNPVDHPHGGGKGKKSKNAAPEPPWGRRGKRKKNVKKLL